MSAMPLKATKLLCGSKMTLWAKRRHLAQSSVAQPPIPESPLQAEDLPGPTTFAVEL
jgi:hypothetical protein